MNSRFLFFAGLAFAALSPVTASAEDIPVPAVLPTAPARVSVTLLNDAQLDELVGPIALHPDALVALVLPAAGAPSDIVLAARYVSAGGLIAKVDEQPWDDSVKSLARYPDIVQWLDENLAWTKQLGEAFAVQPAGVMKAIQRMRAKARALGTLKDSPQQRVEVVEEVIRIVPAEPDVIYVPYYDPEVVYISHPTYYSNPFITFSAGFAAGYWLAYDFDWHVHRLWVIDHHRRERWWHDHHRHHGWHRWTPHHDHHHHHDRPRPAPRPDFCQEWKPREGFHPRPGRGVSHGSGPVVVHPRPSSQWRGNPHANNGRWNGRDGDNRNDGRRDDRDRRDSNDDDRRRRPESGNRGGVVRTTPSASQPAPGTPQVAPPVPTNTPPPVATAPATGNERKVIPRQNRDRTERRGNDTATPSTPAANGAVAAVPVPAPAPVTVTPPPSPVPTVRNEPRRERSDRTDRADRTTERRSGSVRAMPTQPNVPAAAPSYTPPPPQGNQSANVAAPSRPMPQPSQSRPEYSQPRRESSQPRQEHSQPRTERTQPRNDYAQQPREERTQRTQRESYSAPRQERSEPRENHSSRSSERSSSHSSGRSSSHESRSAPPPPPAAPPPSPPTQSTEQRDAQ